MVLTLLLACSSGAIGVPDPAPTEPPTTPAPVETADTGSAPEPELPPEDHVFRIQWADLRRTPRRQTDYYVVFPEDAPHHRPPWAWLLLTAANLPQRILYAVDYKWSQTNYDSPVPQSNPGRVYSWGEPQGPNWRLLTANASGWSERLNRLTDYEVVVERDDQTETVHTYYPDGRGLSNTEVRVAVGRRWGWNYVHELDHDRYTTQTWYGTSQADQPEIEEVRHVFDEQGRWIEQYRTSFQGTSQLFRSRSWDETGRVATNVLPNGSVQVETFDEQGRRIQVERYAGDPSPETLEFTNEWAFDAEGRTTRDSTYSVASVTREHGVVTEYLRTNGDRVVVHNVHDDRGRLMYQEARLEDGTLDFWYQMEDLGPLEGFDLDALREVPTPPEGALLNLMDATAP